MGQCASELATERPKRRVAAPTIGSRRGRRRPQQLHLFMPNGANAANPNLAPPPINDVAYGGLENPRAPLVRPANAQGVDQQQALAMDHGESHPSAPLDITTLVPPSAGVAALSAAVDVDDEDMGRNPLATPNPLIGSSEDEHHQSSDVGAAQVVAAPVAIDKPTGVNSVDGRVDVEQGSSLPATRGSSSVSLEHQGNDSDINPSDQELDIVQHTQEEQPLPPLLIARLGNSAESNCTSSVLSIEELILEWLAAVVYVSSDAAEQHQPQKLQQADSADVQLAADEL
jgi:hypothetical protein